MATATAPIATTTRIVIAGTSMGGTVRVADLLANDGETINVLILKIIKMRTQSTIQVHELTLRVLLHVGVSKAGKRCIVIIGTILAR